MTAKQVYERQEALRRADEARHALAEQLAREALSAARAGALVSTTDWMSAPSYREATAQVEALQAEVSGLQDEVGGVVYRIPSVNLGILTEKLDKLVKRAKKLGIAEVVYRVTDEVDRVETKLDPLISIVELGYIPQIPKSYTYVVLHAGVVKLSGWLFLATLTIEDGGVMVSKIPAFARAWQLYNEGVTTEAPGGYRRESDDPAISAAQALLEGYDLNAYRDPEKATHCDHCGLSRRRTATYLVESVETGEIKQVGKNCLRDFLGTDPAQIMRYASILADIEGDLDGEEGWGLTGEARAWLSEEYLTHVCAMIRLHGWAPRSSHQDPTADQAWSNLWNYGKSDKHGPMYEEVIEADHERAVAAITWGREILPETARSDFDHNMVVAARSECVPKKGDGILAYLPVAHARHLEREIEQRERHRQDVESEYVGEPGKRMPLTLHVTHIFEYEGNYGPTYITIFRDEHGNAFKWFGSYSLERDWWYDAVWTIKEHDLYKGIKQTVINRPHGLEPINCPTCLGTGCHAECADTGGTCKLGGGDCETCGGTGSALPSQLTAGELKEAISR